MHILTPIKKTKTESIYIFIRSRVIAQLKGREIMSFAIAIPEERSSQQMKLTFDHSELLKSVNIAMKAVSSKTTMPILECILIDASASEIKFISNDMELGIETVVKGTILEKGRVAIDAKTFFEIVRRLPDNIVMMETNENLIVRITCEKSKFDIPGRSADDFPYLPVVDRKDSIRITQYSLRQIINQTIFSIAVNENNKLMTGELFEVENNNLKVVSLDGHRIAIRRIELGGERTDRRVVIPGKALNEVSRILDGGLEDQVTVYFSDDHVIFEFDRTMILTRLIDGEYFNVAQMLSGDYQTKTVINKQDLLSCMNRASLLVKESDKMPVVMNITDDTIELSINTAMGSMDETISAVKDGKDMVIGFNPKFMIDALRVIEDEEISIYYMSPIAPCFIKDDNENYIYLILPVNISR